jgi:hypothetical protein
MNKEWVEPCWHTNLILKPRHDMSVVTRVVSCHQPNRAFVPCCTTASKSQCTKLRKDAQERCWPHPWVCSLSRGGPGGHCRYPENRVPPYTSFESRRRIGHARMPLCPVAPAPRGAPEPPRTPWPRLPSLGLGQLWIRHVPHDSSSRHQAPG